MIEHFHNGPIDINGNRTEMYDYVREANLYLKKAGKGLFGWDNTDVARYENGKMIREGSSPVVTPQGEVANIIIGTYRKGDRARLVISNANCDEPTSFAMNLAAEWVLDQVFTSIDADSSSQDGSLLDWILKPGGSVVIEVKMNRK
jgi:hypothetical protein